VSRRGVETGGPAGAADGAAGAAEGGARGAGEFAEGAGAVAGGAGAVAGAADGVGDGGGGAAAGGDGIGAGGLGGAVASLERRKIYSLTIELTDDIALPALSRMAATPSKYPKACRPRGTKSRKA
jgi:hypothetical protein